MALSFVGFFVICTGLAILALKMNLAHEILPGIKLGLTTGVCFSAAAISITYLYVKKPFGLHLIDGLYHVIGQIIAGVILCAWK